MKTRFPLKDAWIRASPFRDRQTLLEAQKKYEKGESIGFTAVSSLKSMGRIPRSDGAFRVGEKYLAIGGNPKK